jgi:hypothetical protein
VDARLFREKFIGVGGWLQDAPEDGYLEALTAGTACFENPKLQRCGVRSNSERLELPRSPQILKRKTLDRLTRAELGLGNTKHEC